MPHENTGCPAMRSIGCGILAAIVGVPGLVFLAGITFGVILVPVVGVLMLAPFVAVYSILWAPWLGGSAFPRQTQTEHVAEEPGRDRPN